MISNSPRFLAVCLNPTFQRTVRLKKAGERGSEPCSAGSPGCFGKRHQRVQSSSTAGCSCSASDSPWTGKGRIPATVREDNLQISWVDSVSPIRTCITLLDESEDSTTEVIEPTEPVNEGTVSALVDAYERELGNTDWVILSGSKAPGYPPNLFAEFCRLARDTDIPVVADYRGEELLASLPFEPALVKINLVEFAATFLPNLTVSEADDSSALPAVKTNLPNFPPKEAILFSPEVPGPFCVLETDLLRLWNLRISFR
jgi:hypothetical protein